MAKTFKIKKGDQVMVIAGDDKGTVILDRKGEFESLEAYTWV